MQKHPSCVFEACAFIGPVKGINFGPMDRNVSGKFIPQTNYFINEQTALGMVSEPAAFYFL